MANEGIIVGAGKSIHAIVADSTDLYTVCGADFAKRGKYNRGRKVAQAPNCTRCAR